MNPRPRPLVALADETFRQLVADLTGDSAELVVWQPGDRALAAVLDLVVLTDYSDWPALATLSPDRVRAVQLESLGFDGAAGTLPGGIALCNAVGIHEEPTAELAVTLALASQRGWPGLATAQHEQHWRHHLVNPGLLGARVLLVGVGGIGGQIARRLEPFGVELTRVGRTRRTDARGDVHAMADLLDLLPTADVVILALPLSAETRGLVSGDFLSRLPDGALLVNVSRGPVADTAALVEAARSGRVRLALDVVDPEPLPAGHPLWNLPGVLLSPHLGGTLTSTRGHYGRLVAGQIRALAAGDALENVVITAG